MKLKITAAILSLMILLSISSFFWFDSLITAVENGHANQSQLADIKKFGFESHLYSSLNELKPYDRKWQAIAKTLATNDGKIAYKLGIYYVEQQEFSEAKLWFLQAIRLKFQLSRLELAKIYLSESNLNRAKALLLPIITENGVLALLIEIAVTQGNLDFINQYAVRLKEDEVNQALYQKLLKFQIIKNSNIASSPSCLAKIQPFATNLKNLAYFEQLISSEKLEPLSSYVCFSPVRYVSKRALSCQHENNEAIRCDESIWQSYLPDDAKDTEGIRFLAVLAEKGGANVNEGILYLDSEDTDEVFFHEIVHLLGFIDEYPLAKNHQRCLSVQEEMFAHNVAILPRYYQGSKQDVRAEILAQLPWAKYIKSSTKIITETSQGWLLGTAGIEPQSEEVGAFISETCSEQSFIAVKPLKQKTALRYFEEEFPALYLQLLKDSPERFLMESYQYNIARALETLGQKK